MCRRGTSSPPPSTGKAVSPNHVFLRIESCLLSICVSDIARGSEWVLVPGVSPGSPPCGSSGVEKDIIQLFPRLHHTVFLLEEKYWTTLVVRPSEQLTGRNTSILCTRFLYQNQPSLLKKGIVFWSPIGRDPLWWAVVVLIFLVPFPGFRIPGSASWSSGVQQNTITWWWCGASFNAP